MNMRDGLQVGKLVWQTVKFADGVQAVATDPAVQKSWHQCMRDSRQAARSWAAFTGEVTNSCRRNF